MKKTIVVLIVLSAVSGYLYADELLKSIIIKGNWERLPAIFLDNSHTFLKRNFQGCKSIKMIPFTAGQWLYQAKFDSQGEIGIIVFEKRQGRYSKLKMINQIKPLYYIEKFKKYGVSNVRITIGDAVILFKKGSLYESVPYKSFFLFKGEWEFFIKPKDKEEKLTLMRYYKKDYFLESIRTGIFILHQNNFFGRLPDSVEVKKLESDLLPLLAMYQNIYGIKVKQFGEYWYPEFPEAANLIIFEKVSGNDKKSIYYYTFNESLLPDTHLSTLGNRKLILSYNSREGLKPRLGKSGGVSRLNLKVNINPLRNYVSGNTWISYENPASLRELKLGRGIDLKDNLGLNNVNVFRVKDKCYVLPANGKKLSLHFNGNVKPFIGDFEFFRSSQVVRSKITKEGSGSLYFLSKTQNFYPNPGNFFFKSDVTVNLPLKLNCLAPGNLVEKTVKNGVTFRYCSLGTKGISLVVGPFKRTKKLDAKIPINLYTLNSFEYPKKFDLAELKRAADFFITTFGSLDLSAVNILLKKSWVEGGVSNNGFIVAYLLPDMSIKEKKDFFQRVRSQRKSIEKKVLPPSLIRNRSEDCILHELAHQWWGGMVAGKNYQDVWITEGLAQFSVLYYLKQILPDKRFNRIIKKIKRWVYRYSDSGPIIYGTRIHSLEDSYEAFQSIVYNKSTLVLLMLMELIGEEDFAARLRSVLGKYKYKNITTMQFIRQFSAADKMVFDFFKNWIFSRALPEVKLELVEDDPEYDQKELKKIVLNIRQLNTDFIFPLKLRVVSRKGFSFEYIIMKEKEERFIITRDSSILSINVADSLSPIKEKK